MRPHPRTVLASAGVAAVLALSLTACGEEEVEPTASDPAPESSQEPSESTTSAPTPQSSEEDPQPIEGAVPVYFVGDGPQGARLYREFHPSTGADPLDEAVRLLVEGAALDPDYRTLLGELDVASVSHTDGAYVVDLTEDSVTADKSMSPAQARIAVQSLVYTLQAADQDRDPVRVTVAGAPTRLFDQPTDTGVEAADPLDVLNLVSVSNPAEGTEVSGTFTADGVASSFEATVPWQVRTEAGEVVAEGFATADGWMDKLYPWTVDVDVSDLEPGTYVFAALTDDPTGGAEGPGPSEDTKTIVVG